MENKELVTAKYYVEKILEGPCLSAFQRKARRGRPLERRMVEKMSTAIFQKDGAPSHRSFLAQKWCEDHLSGFWEKEILPPDLPPIENLWAILKMKLAKNPGATNLDELKKQVKTAWAEIEPKTLRKLIEGMPKRMETCFQLKGGYIGK